MSTKCTLKYHSEENARFSLYHECFDQPITFVYLELDGVPFEVESSAGLSGKGPSSLTVRIPVHWAPNLIAGFQAALLEAFVPIEVHERACEVFKKQDAALAWLLAKPIVFGGKSAIELCMEGKAEVVIHELGVIEGECSA